MTKISGKNEKFQTVGRRKRASARARLDKGDGTITVNGKSYQAYFPYFEHQEMIMAPLKALGKEKEYTIIKVRGGGIRGQVDAAQLGIARALVKWNEDWRKTMKTIGYLTRDARIKERKKPGKKRARRAPQWSKR